MQYEPKAWGGDDEIEHAVEIEVQGGDGLTESLVGCVAVEGPHRRSRGVAFMTRGCCGQIDRVVALRRRLRAKDHKGRPHLGAVALQRGEARCCGTPAAAVSAKQPAGLGGLVGRTTNDEVLQAVTVKIGRRQAGDGDKSTKLAMPRW